MANKPAIDLGDVWDTVTAPARAYGRAVRSYSRSVQSTRPDRFPEQYPRKSLAGRTAFKGGAPRKKSAAGRRRKKS